MRRSKVESNSAVEKPESASRRSFAKTVAVSAIAAAAPLASSVMKAQTPNTTKETPAPPKPQATPAAKAAAATPPPSPLALAYAEVARIRFGDQLTSEQLTQLQKEMAGNVRVADSLRAVKLKNADEPDFVFNA
ncbi:MAG: hypothetical protein ABR577_18185 [Pyrinomonadaceae bacterium]